MSAPGYVTQQRPIGPLTTNRVEDFALNVDVEACNAPGYEWFGVRESFATSITPTNWIVSTTLSSAAWRFNNPGNKTNLTGGTGGFAIGDSDYAGPGVNMNTELRSPLMNLTTVTTPTLTFKTDFNHFDGGSSEVADVDVSVDDGATWNNIWQRTASYRGPQTATISDGRRNSQP